VDRCTAEGAITLVTFQVMPAYVKIDLVGTGKMHRRFLKHVAVVLITLAGVSAQAADNAHDSAVAHPDMAWEAAPQLSLSPGQIVSVPTTTALPRLAPELALQFAEKHAEWQNLALSGYRDEVEVEAVLPDTSQQGDFQLVREYSSPNALSFTPVKFTGDDFVKHNVIIRLLQSEVDHVQKGDGGQTALNSKNYKFSYKGTDEINGHLVHVFQVKPRHKVPGLFKGKIYVDAFTGSLRRAEGAVVKSPSFFIKKIEFVQDYDDVNGFNFPVSMHSTAVTRVIGRAVVNIFHRNYQPIATGQGSALAGAAADIR
jgi:hypothetical protein